MGTSLRFASMKIKGSKWQEGASVPFISQIHIHQNDMVNELSEDDPLNVGFGTIGTIYPYTQQNIYTRTLEEKDVETVELENDYLKATFIPSLGGKLWSLYDKVNQKELLYVNDVIRPSNLAVRNAWVSGGVEWNIGVIGHSPFTCDQLFVGTFEVEGMPILRMYEFERIRKVTYQMDFFLPEDSKFLLCRMRIVNPNEEMVPMYWWSNIAVPELQKGRLVVDADSAYTSTNFKVHKVGVPMVDHVDISYPIRIPIAVDYFFDIPEEKRKFITHLDEEGYGLIQTSTSRLQGRKLFVWGQKEGSHRWQQFLNEKAGNYIEIQAGLAKTQYGCLPMPKESEWEWLEAYGAMQVDKEKVDGDWRELREIVGEVLEEVLPVKKLEEMLVNTRETIALKQAELKEEGSLFGAIENHRRTLQGKDALSQHLDFGDAKGQSEWVSLLTQNTLGSHDPNEAPGAYMMEETYYHLLEEATRDKDKDNWYTWYHLGLNQLVRNRIKEAIETLNHALTIQISPFIHHTLAMAYANDHQGDKAMAHAKEAMKIRANDIGLIKDCIGLLIRLEDYEGIIQVTDTLPDEIRHNTRVKICKSFAYAKCDRTQEAEDLLIKEGYLEVEDVREGEFFTSELWEILQENKEGKEDIPFALDFRML